MAVDRGGRVSDGRQCQDYGLRKRQSARKKNKPEFGMKMCAGRSFRQYQFPAACLSNYLKLSFGSLEPKPSLATVGGKWGKIEWCEGCHGFGGPPAFVQRVPLRDPICTYTGKREFGGGRKLS